MSLKSLWVSIPIFMLFFSACEKTKLKPKVQPRPVSALTLGQDSPTKLLRMTGSVEPYREEKIAFEVSGRIEYVLDVGSDVEGEVFDDSGAVVRAGDVLARIDATRYQLAHDAARLKLASSEENLVAQKIDLEQVAQAQLIQSKAQLNVARSEVNAARATVKTAKAKRIFARQTLDRERKLFKMATRTQADLDRAQSEYDAKDASFSQAEAGLTAKQRGIPSYEAAIAGAKASIQLKKAKLKATQAQLEELAQGVKKAQEDLNSCTLRTPFTGRISARHISRGAFVNTGLPIVTLTMFDPLKVSFAVSATKNARIRFGDPVLIRLHGAKNQQVVQGFVDQKGEVADAATRTFRIDAIVRNFLNTSAAGSESAVQLAFKRDIFVAFQRIDDRQKRVFLPTRCLLKEGGKLYVLTLPGRIEDGLRTWTKAFQPKKVEVKLGPMLTMFTDFHCQELLKGSKLKKGTFLIVNPKRLIAKDGKIKMAVQSSKLWQIRPGDLVSVELDLGKDQSGFYVPVQSVVTRNNKTWLYIVEDGKVKRIDVEVGEQAGARRLVSNPGLKAGMKVIVKGRHYVREGEAVRIVDGFLTR
jgi:multidrug resistance efflux pump